MKNKNTWLSALIWFGAAISVAEVEAGREIGANWSALLYGHLLGGLILFAAGLIGARLRQGAMATTTSAFGDKGARFFAFLNVIQLIGWIAVMNEQTTHALTELNACFDSPITHIVLSALVGLWVIIGILKTTRLATLAMGALAVLMAYLSYRLFGDASLPQATEKTMPFWTAFELSAAMPLSWAPVIADYTRTAERPVRQSGLSALVYTFASIWMYVIGMMLGGTETTLPAAIVLHKLIAVGIPILIVSTVTTNLLAAHSAGESALVVCRKFNAKVVVAVSVALAAAISITVGEEHYITFLLFIASVFAPMAAVLITSHFFVKRAAPKWNFIAWVVGFIVYHVANRYQIAPTPISLTLSALLAAGARLLPKK